MDVVGKIVLIALLIILNGFFVAAEYSLVAVRKTRIDELVKKQNSAALLVQHAQRHIDRYISATQLGITIVSLAVGWLGEPILAGSLEPFFRFLPQNIAFISAHIIGVIVSFLLITFFDVIVGELVPKNVALQRSESTVMFTIRPLILFASLFNPFIWLLNNTGGFILHMIGISDLSTKDPILSEEEVKMVLAQSSRGGTIPEDEVRMVNNVFALGDTSVNHIMVPRTEVIGFSESTSFQEIMQKVKENTHSRYPIFRGSIDHIVGFIHIKDIYKSSLSIDEKRSLSKTDLMREIISVPKTKRADDVLLEMKKKRVHIAVIVDEYGGTEGIVTFEDIIEGLVGEIHDEFDEPKSSITKLSEGNYEIDGHVSIERVQNKFHLQLKGHGYTTIGGLVFGLLGRTPKVGDEVQVGNIVFVVKAIDDRRIKTLILKKEGKK